MIDPNAAIHMTREVRVTRRSPVLPGFIAPELSPVRTTDQELDKLRPGWTDRTVKPEVVVRNGGVVRGARKGPDFTAGKEVIRKASSAPKYVAAMTGPSADYKARQLRAAKLAARQEVGLA